MKSIKVKSVKLNKILDNSRNVKSYFIALIFLCGLVAILELTISNTFFNPIHAQIEITTDENITPPIFNETKSEDSQSRPDILYSALNKDTVVGEVLNNFSYPIELVP